MIKCRQASHVEYMNNAKVTEQGPVVTKLTIFNVESIDPLF